ncbi:MAG: monovalent cation/H(+) antiporter subunit G [Gammaproteobacteria bacterium]|nr:monovalent cation/H(+) antiporter subunit G [Gammaproteobacteria bacterium]
MSVIGLALCGLGVLVVLIAAVGVVRLPDALSRQHAATKAGTVGVGLLAVGVALAEPAWVWRVGLLVALLLVTLPLASHALARAAVRGAAPSEASHGPAAD